MKALHGLIDIFMGANVKGFGNHRQYQERDFDFATLPKLVELVAVCLQEIRVCHFQRSPLKNTSDREERKSCNPVRA